MAGKKLKVSQSTVAVVILFIVLVTRMGGNIFLPSIPQITEDFQISKAQATLNINLYTLALALSFAFLGPLTDMVKKGTLLLYGSIACVISYLLCGFASNIYMIDAGRLILAIGSSLIIITAQTWIGSRSGKNELLGRLAWFSLLVTLAPMVAAVIGGYVTDNLSWRWNFWLMLILTAMVIAVILLLKNSPTDKQSTVQKYSALHVLKTYQDVILNTSLMRISLVIFCLFMFQGAFLTFSSFLLIGEMGVTAGQYGLLSMVLVGGMLVGRFPTMYMEKHFSIRFAMTANTIVVIASMIGSLLYFQLVHKHTILEIMVFMTLLRFGFSGLSIFGMRNCMVIDPNRKGALAGLYSFMNHLSGWVGVLLTQLFFSLNLLSVSIYNYFLIISLVLIVLGTYIFLRGYSRIKNLLENSTVMVSGEEDPKNLV